MNNEFIMKPKVDFCFKELMEDEFVRKGFISAILHIHPKEILRTDLLSTHLRKEHENDKLGILDVRILLNGNIQIDMEIQLSPFRLWAERSLFYLGKMYVGQFQKGKSYDVFGKCIHVGILDFELFPEDEEYYAVFHLWEDIRRRKYTDKIELHILELPKIAKHDYPETELLNWMRFMNAERKEEFEMLAKENEYMEKAYERLVNLSADEEKQLEYEARQKAIMDHDYLMQYSREEGMRIGMENGMKAGMVETCKELGVSKEKTVEKLMQKFAMQKTEATCFVEEYWEKMVEGDVNS